MTPPFVYFVAFQNPLICDHTHSLITASEPDAHHYAEELADTYGTEWVTIDRLAVFQTERIYQQGADH